MDNLNQPDEQKINEQFDQQFGKPKDLPNAVASLVLGIVSTVLGVFWCYWIGSFIALVCGIIAISMSNGGKKLLQNEPGVYSKTSIGNNDAGKILGIIGICLGSLGILVLIVLAIAFGFIIGTG
jgi:hypothetical protein